jgi:hypothetical protein
VDLAMAMVIAILLVAGVALDVLAEQPRLVPELVVQAQLRNLEKISRLSEGRLFQYLAPVCLSHPPLV